MNLDRAISELLTKLAPEYIKTFQSNLNTVPYSGSLPTTDTGRAAASLRFEVLTAPGGSKLAIYGIYYSYWLRHGRKPGKKPPFSVIHEWVKRKLGKKDPEAKGIAYAIRNKIGARGTNLYIRYQPLETPIYKDLQTQEAVRNGIKANVKNAILEALRGKENPV